MPASALGRRESSGALVALGSPIDDSIREGSWQRRHPAPEGSTARIRSRLGAARGYQPRDRFATISDRNLAALSDLFDQASEVLSGFTDTRILHSIIVLHVAHGRNVWKSPLSLMTNNALISVSMSYVTRGRGFAVSPPWSADAKSMFYYETAELGVAYGPSEDAKRGASQIVSSDVADGRTVQHTNGDHSESHIGRGPRGSRNRSTLWVKSMCGHGPARR